MNTKNFLMIVKCIQDALPVDVPMIKISYWCICGCRLRDHSMTSKVHSISPNLKSPMH